MKQRYDIMLTGVAAAQAMRVAYLTFEQESMVGSEDADPDELLEDTPEYRDSLLCADAGFEDRLIANADESRYGEEAEERHLRDMRRIVAREKLPAVIEHKLLVAEDAAGNLTMFRRIKEAQAVREAVFIGITRKKIVHEPVVEVTPAEYNKEQDALEAELAQRFPDVYTALFGGHHAADIMVSDVTRVQRNTPDYDERMHAAMTRIEPIIRANPRPRASFQEVSAPQNNNAPARRDSERP